MSERLRGIPRGGVGRTDAAGAWGATPGTRRGRTVACLMVGEIRPFAGDAASKVPFVGGQLKKPLRSAAEAGTGLADAGRSLQDTVGHVAMLTTVALIVIPVVFVLLLWLPPRLRWIRRSAVTRRLAAGPGGADILALRVLTGSQRELAALPTPPGGLAEAWRRGDKQVIADLAAIGLRQAGLRA
ncbi:hypothetical protein [Streptomyces sp. NBC_01602]|uniref:hypothetical protein n=1 Tax=Streptomyces sp. NBC_01602 TaxID=2975893 RepID=UPI00386B32F8|nr:hypothetical protein OG955_00970 [Streptomyces sp. NBC_01602]